MVDYPVHSRIRSTAALLVGLVVATISVHADEPTRNGVSTARGDWKPLFNGKDLSGWHVVLTPDHKGIDPAKVFQVHDGVIHVYKDVPAGAPVPIGYLASNESYSSFHLQLEYRWVGKRFAPRTQRPRDAGILYHAAADPRVWPRSVECQIQENDVGDCFTVRGAQVASTFDPERLKAGEFRYLPAKDGGVAGVQGGPGITRIVKGSTHENDGWNTVEVILRGAEEVIHIVNGHEVFRATDLRQLDGDQKTWIPLASGHILLQGEYAEVLYRNIQIKPLDGRPFRVDGAEWKSPIKPAADGAYRLPAAAAELSGKSVRHNVKLASLEEWLGSSDRANWRVNNSKMGDFDVVVTWSVAEENAAQAYNIQIDHKATIRALTVSTGGEFKREVVGRIMLAPGVRDVTFFPAGKAARGGLCKLQQIELVPVVKSEEAASHEPLELHVPSGFQVERVAGPPLTFHPMLACFDERGRLYVAESTGVNADGSVLAESPPHDIRILDDTDGDGRYDKVTIFADKLTFPQGLAWHDGSVYVSSPPNFWRLSDTDGDDVADSREVLATGFPLRGMSDDMHGASLGPDGRLYFAAGRFPHKIRRPNGPVIHEGYNPVLVRCRPDGSDLEVYCGAMGNAVGVAFSDAGDCFASGTFGVNANGKRDVLNHCVEGGAYPVLGQQLVDHKLTGDPMPNLMQFGASASSDVMIYRDAAFGAGYRGNLFSALFNLHKVARHVLQPDGATYRCHNEDFLTSSNADFHPTDVLEDADGSLLVVDTGAWFLIGCPTSVIAKPQISGGIYRVRRLAAVSPRDPWGMEIDWHAFDTPEIVKLLSDPRFAVRDRAMAALAKRGDDSISSLAEALAGESSPLSRINAIWTLVRIGTPRAAAVSRRALNDPDAEVRQTAATAAGLFRDRGALAQLMEAVASDSAMFVRREAAASLGRIGDRRAVPALVASLSGVTDRFLDHAIILALIRLDDREQTAPALADSSPEVRRGALIALDQMDHGQLSQADVTRVLESEDARVQKAALEVIARHPGWANEITQLATEWLSTRNLSDDRQAALRGVLLALANNKSVQALISRSLSDESAPHWARLLLLDVIAQSESAALLDQCRAPIVAALRSGDDEIARAAVAAVSASRQAADTHISFDKAELLALTRDRQRPANLRVAAFAAAARPNEELPADIFELLIGECGPSNEPMARLEAAGVLGSANLAAPQLKQMMDLISTAGPLELPALLRAVENSDVNSVGRPLLAALDKSPGLSALPADRLFKLIERLPAEHRDQADALLRRTAVDLAGQRRRLEELKDVLSGGDPERGRLLFFGAKASCSACHRVGEEGGNIGPNLAGIGEIRTRRDLLEAVAFPSASFARNFEPYTVLTTSGMTHSGIISRATSDAVYLTTGERKTIRIPRSEIEADGITSSQVSIMPQGLDRILEPAELTDLLAYLASLRDTQRP